MFRRTGANRDRQENVKLLEEGFNCQLYLQLVERFKIYTGAEGFEQEESLLEICLYKEEYYKSVQIVETEDKQVKECMIQWARTMENDLLMEQ